MEINLLLETSQKKMDSFQQLTNDQTTHHNMMYKSKSQKPWTSRNGMKMSLSCRSYGDSFIFDKSVEESMLVNG